MSVRYVSLFSGIEAASVAWEPYGWEPVAFSEIEPFPCELLRQRFPKVPNLGDITKIDWGDFLHEHGAVDLVVGGSPCQSFSVAGNREGLAGESGLMFEYIRAVRELRPKWLVWENVPGALSSEDGGAFGQLLEEMDVLGYGLAWGILDAQFFGVAQRRRRVFVVGCLGDPERAAEVLFERGRKQGNTKTSGEKRQELAPVFGCGSSDGYLTPWDCQSKRIHSANGTAPTLQAGRGGGVGNPIIHYVLPFNLTQVTSRQNGNNPKWGDPCHCLAARDRPPHICIAEEGFVVVRRLMPVECERLQGFPDGWTDIEFKGKPASDTARYKALGNSMAVPVMAWIGERIDQCELFGRVRDGDGS